MIDKSVEGPAEALAGLGDGMSVMVSGFGGAGVPVALLRALDAAGAKNLTLIVNAARFVYYNAAALFDDRRVRRVVCSAARHRESESSAYERQWTAGELEIEMVPQGTLAERIRAGGAGIPAFFTPTGVGTELTAGKEVRRFDGRDCVLETALTADYAILRAHVADRWGNVRFHGTQANFGPAMASAARIAVVEVDHISDGPLDPLGVHLPGIHVDRVVAVSRQARGGRD